MQIRPAVLDDAMPVARVHVRSWQVAYRGLLPDPYLEALQPGDRVPHYDFTHTDPARPYTLVAQEAGEVLGFATTIRSRDQDLSDSAEVAALYVAPQHWRKGIGRLLIAAACQLLLHRGYHDALLWVLAGNARAEQFYQSEGWRPDGARRRDTVWGVTVDELRYVRAISPADPFVSLTTTTAPSGE